MIAAGRLLLAGSGLLLYALGTAAAPQVIGGVTSVTQFTNGASLGLAGGGQARIEFLAPATIRVSVTPHPSVTALPTGAVIARLPAAGSANINEDATNLFVTQGNLVAIVVKQPLQIVLMRIDGSLLSADIPGGMLWDPDTGTITARKFALAGEAYLGMGLRGGVLDRRGRRLTMRNTDSAGYGEFSDPLYSSTPFYYGQHAGGTYGLFFDNPSISFFDFDAAGSGVLSFAAQAGTLDYYVFAGPTPRDVASAFSQLTGTNPLPPRWALGLHQSRFGYASADQLLQLAGEFRRRAIPCDAFYLDIDHLDRVQQFAWNPSGFPDPLGMNAALAASGFQRVNIVEPIVTTNDRLWPWFAASNYFVSDANAQPLVNSIFLGPVSWIDFTRPAARNFYKTQLKTFIGTGLSGIWADLNEPAQNFMPEAVYDFDGQPRFDHAARNVYALHETELFSAALSEARPGQRPFVLSRAGFPGIQRYAANWGGDGPTSYDALRVAVQMSASMGLSGQNLFGHDVGGFLGSPGPELFLRWLQFASVTPLMRIHSNFDTAAREPWRFGEPYTSLARATIEFRYRMMPYLYSLFAQAERDGTPVLAPTYFYFPRDPRSLRQDGEFMLGPALLVAPVVVEGARTRRVYLPAGSEWLDYHTGTRYPGGADVEVAAPIERLPMFVRAGALLPSAPVRQYAGERVPEYIVIDVFPGAPGEFLLYDDDGATLDYRAGVFRSTRLAWSEDAQAARLELTPVGGQAPPIPRPWWLQLRDWPQAPTAVTVDGIALPQAASPDALVAGGWTYDAARRTLVVRVPGTLPPRAIVVTRAAARAALTQP